jgi:hypothetical protein
LCSVCIDNYFKTEGRCEECVSNNFLTPTAIAFIIVAILFINIAGVLFYISINSSDDIDNNNEEEEKDLSSFQLFMLWLRMRFSKLMIKVKIVVSTFQIVMETPSTINITMPIAFTNFVSSLR